MKEILLLNMGYQPLCTIPWRKAMDLVYFRNKAEVVVEYGDSRPAVVRLSVKTPDPSRWQKFRSSGKYRKEVVLKRDNYTCVYCNAKPAKKDLTIDHVIPRSKGGMSTYDNCVAACLRCNHYKDNLLLHEAGMRMMFRSQYTAVGNSFYDSAPEEWLPFIKQ